MTCLVLSAFSFRVAIAYASPTYAQKLPRSTAQITKTETKRFMITVSFPFEGC
ncbi:hypothetical protein ABIE67_010115 [Streptomyces sp. V4I8]